MVYINSDSTATGWLTASGSHSLQGFVNDVMRDLPDPKRPGKTLFQAKLDRALNQAKTTRRRRASDCTPRFPDRRARIGIRLHGLPRLPDVASLNLGFGGEASDGGVYHSTYDSFYWYTHFSDTDFTYNAALSRVIGTAILRLADADILPFEFTSTAKTLGGYVDELEELQKGTKDANAR